jgi:cytoskeletal protein CcmA (bactofilin family)
LLCPPLSFVYKLLSINPGGDVCGQRPVIRSAAGQMAMEEADPFQSGRRVYTLIQGTTSCSCKSVRARLKPSTWCSWKMLPSGQMLSLNRRPNSLTVDGATATQATSDLRPLTTILRGMKVAGQISAREDIYVDVEINGPIVSDSKVTIGPNGIVHGPIKAREIVILGRVIGNIDATDKVAVAENADLRGDIQTLHISMDEKAYFMGKVNCRPLDAQLRPFPPASESRTVPPVRTATTVRAS